MKKLIAVYFDDPAFDGYPFNKEEYRESYHDFAQILLSKGATLAIVRGKETYLGHNRFTHGWVFDGRSFVHMEGPLEPDLIYDKGTDAFDPTARLAQDPDLERLCTQKDLTYALFPDFSPLTVLVHSPEESYDALQRMQTDFIVLKPVDGQEGFGVSILPRNKVTESIPSFPYLLQEFIDTSAGIPGITEGRHDLRIVSIRGEPVQAFVRTTPVGSYLANIAQGGQSIEVPIPTIPQDALSLFFAVDAKLRRFPHRVYSTDMGRDRSGRWHLIELNAKPGLLGRFRGSSFVRFQELLADLLLSVLSQGITSHDS